jgi:hypothetical protein
MTPESEWLTTAEAASVVGTSTSRIGVLARHKQWRTITIQQETMKPRTFFAKEDVFRSANSAQQGRTLAFITMRDWVDELPPGYRPSAAEMAEHATPPFHVADVESLVETREYRRNVRFNRPKKHPERKQRQEKEET